MNNKCINITNKKFGRLLVIKRVKRKHRYKWLCKCDCGNIKAVDSSALRRGATKSCGCLHREKCGGQNRLRPYESLYNTFIGKAKVKHLKVLSYKQFLKFTTILNCHYCKSPITWAKYYPNKNGSGYNLDRKNNKKGYTVNNCVVCCKRCNAGKSNIFTYEQWLQIGKLIQSWEK